MKKPLSPRQQDVYNLILAAHQQRRPAPTYREIGDALGIKSTNGVADHVEACIKKGWVKRGPAGQARTLAPTKGHKDLVATLRQELAEEARAADMHRELNRRVAGALGLLETRKDPETGLDYLPSWHDMPEQVAALVAKNARLLAQAEAFTPRWLSGLPVVEDGEEISVWRLGRKHPVIVKIEYGRVVFRNSRGEWELWSADAEWAPLIRPGARLPSTEG